MLNIAEKYGMTIISILVIKKPYSLSLCNKDLGVDEPGPWFQKASTHPFKISGSTLEKQR